MQITRQADYATWAVLHFARAGNKNQIPTRHVAKEQNIPFAFLPKIISQLSIVGILQTSRGGIKIAREPQNITLLEVIEAIDGPIKLNACVRREGTCLFEDNCPSRSVWCDIQKEMMRN